MNPRDYVPNFYTRDLSLVDQSIGEGDLVRAYDPPEGVVGLYTEGVILECAILGSYPRYLIKPTKRVFDGRDVTPNRAHMKDIFYAIVNGTPDPLRGYCNHVVKL